MTEYLALSCDSIEGREVRMVLELPDPVDYRSATIGQLQVFIGDSCFRGMLNRGALNK